MLLISAVGTQYLYGVISIQVSHALPLISLAGLLLFGFFLSASSLSRMLLESVCSIVCDILVDAPLALETVQDDDCWSREHQRGCARRPGFVHSSLVPGSPAVYTKAS